MNVEIHKLAPELIDDYLYFFENVAHSDNKEWDRCYCVGYCSDDTTGKDFSSAQVRRDYAIEYVQSGKIQGYLAYYDDQVVGWCNANRKSDCLQCGGWKFTAGDVEWADTGQVKSIFCFTVAPAMRRQGIATQLLGRVCQDAADEGFDYIEAYPNKGYTDMYYDYVGPLGLYKKFGFILSGETEQRLIMQKHLK